MQSELVRWFRNTYDVLLIAIPNGDYRSWRTGAKLKREGVVAGTPDLILAYPNDHAYGLFLELKQRGNRPSEAQVDVLDQLRAVGYEAWWCDAYDDARALLEMYMNNEPVQTL
jgi:hypothetical protein